MQRGSDRTLHTAGVAEVGTDDAPTVDDHMRIASVAKAFSGATALSLVDEGVMSLDDTIAQRLPELPAAWGEVTLRQLLNHTSGRARLHPRPSRSAMRSRASLDEAPPPAELLAFVDDEPLDFPPGTQYAYSNSDNIVVGLMIETATGQSYADVLTEEVLEPLGLDDTSLPTGTEMPEPYIHGYQLDDEGQPRTSATSPPRSGRGRPAGSSRRQPTSTTSSAATSAVSCSATRCVRPSKTCSSRPAAPTRMAQGDNSATMALFRYQTECGTVYGHSGNIFGYTQFAVASPDGRRSVTVSITLQRTQKNEEAQAASVFIAQQRMWEAAICYVLE